MHITLGDEIRVLPGAEGVRRACEQMVDFYALSVRNHVVDWHMFQRFFPTGIHPDVTDRRR